MHDFDRILIIDDNEDALLALRLLLKKHAKEVITEKDPRKIPFLLNQKNYDAILLDMNVTENTNSDKEGFHWLNEIIEHQPRAAVIMITAYGNVEMAVRALRAGASDFILKPWENAKLIATLQAAIEHKKEAQTLPSKSYIVEKTKTPNDVLDSIIGESQAIKDVIAIIKKVAVTDANVLILGENGTGKEVIAQAIHALSKRKENTFIGVDMGAITETLFESELFGHKKGAFTDAKEDRAGRFEAAHQGTLFLDEIGNLSLTLQSKLLTVLQRREVVRVGSNKPIPVDIRLVCATNMHIYKMVQENEFRQDLLYRINTIEVHLPPLRERTGDIPILAKHFIDIYCKKYHIKCKKLDQSAIQKLENHPFYGNVRELQHAIERAIIMSEGDTLKADDFLFLSQKHEANDLEINDFNLENIERTVIQKAISKHAGNISQAAKVLGLTRAALYRRMKKYEI